METHKLEQGLGVENIGSIHLGAHYVVFRAIEQQTGESVILKLPAGDPPKAGDIVRLHHEYKTMSMLDSPYVTKVLGLVERDGILALRMEDIGGESLNCVAGHGNFIGLETGLEIAIKVCKGLHAIHAKKIAHRDLNSRNIVADLEGGRLNIIDFGISSLLDNDMVSPKAPNKLDGNLAYISPEQTGRMNRPVDYRTDFYSLGATLFQVFTGSLPFDVRDPLELIHCHIAKPPPSPRSLNPNIPDALERLIFKLMEKNAELRYQSARGIELDLEEILAQARGKGKAGVDFELGRFDHADRFLIPSKLYGRQEEVTKLMDAFGEVSEGEMVLAMVSGYSGVGKSSLVQELYRPLAARMGRYISGKFDQYQRDVPYSALAYGLNSFCHQLLAGEPSEIEAWKTKVLGAVGKNGQVLLEIVPSAQGVIGHQPPVPEVEPQAAKNRFEQVLKDFLSVACSASQPLVIFLDDLQWVDRATLELFRSILLGDPIAGLHIVGAYRDNKVEDSHPLSLLLGELSKASKRYEELHLGNLSLFNVTELVADTLNMGMSAVGELVGAIYGKTHGNAFFTREFFKGLYERAFLYHDGAKWSWDLPSIERENLTDNVVEFVAGKVKEFSRETQHALKYAACIGNEFDLGTLAVILEADSDIRGLFQEVEPALHSGVVRARDEEYKKLGIVDVDPSGIVFKFQHDRVQQAVYSLILPGERPQIHLSTARLLKNAVDTPEELADRLFEIVSHYNKSLHAINDPAEKLGVIELNYQAGMKARASAAYSASAGYIWEAMALLPQDAFQGLYEMAIDIYIDLARALYINGQSGDAELLYPIMVENAKTTMDQVRVRMVQMEDYHLQGNYDHAIETQRSALELLGEDYPGSDEALELAIGKELDATPDFLRGRIPAQLLKAESLEDPETLAKLRILAGMWMSAYLVSKDSIVQWCSIRMTNLTLQHGNSEYASFAYVQYAYVCVRRLKQYEKGWDFGNLAIQLSDNYEDVEMRGRVYFNFAIFVNHWTRHVSTSTELFRKAYSFSLEAGDWTYAVYGAANILSNLLIEGKPAAEVLAEGGKYLEFLKSRAEVGFKSFFLPGGYVPLLDLLGKTEAAGNFDCNLMQEGELLSTLGKLPIVEAWFYSAKIRALYMYRRTKEAAEVAWKADIVEEGVPSQTKIPEARFYACLAIAAAFDSEADKEERASLSARFNRYANEFKEWAGTNEANFMHKSLLVEAEGLRFQAKKPLKALQLYDQAYEAAIHSGYTNNAALAKELKARFWLESDQPGYAAGHLQEAMELYTQWGVSGKCHQLSSVP